MQPAADSRSRRARSLRPAAPVPPIADEAAHAAPALPVLGRWRLVRQVASGEQAALYQARPVNQPADAPADYLVKVACGEDSSDLPASLLRREKTVTSRFSHPHLPAVLDSDLAHDPPFLVFASAGAPGIGDVSPHPLRRALWRARQVATALAALHQAGWIHAHLAPSALLVSQRGQVTLHDLGWARRIGTAECQGEHLLAADLRYVAPEMLCDAAVLTPACDVYALGLLLIELLIRRPAVDAPVGWQAALAHLRGQIADVGELRPDAPAALVELLEQMTFREPLRRPSAQEVERQLVRLELVQLSGARLGSTRWR